MVGSRAPARVVCMLKAYGAYKNMYDDTAFPIRIHTFRSSIQTTYTQSNNIYCDGSLNATDSPRSIPFRKTLKR